MSEKELKSLFQALDSFLDAGIPAKKLEAAAKRLGIEWRA